MNNDLDDVIYLNKKEPNNMSEENNQKTEKQSHANLGLGLDVGTGFLNCSSYKTKNKIEYNSLRNAFFTLDKESFNKQMFDKGKMKYIEISNNIYVIGEDALTLSKIKNQGAKRPLSSGILNPQEREAAPILKEMFRYCIEPMQKEKGEKVVYSIPGPKLYADEFNVSYHSMSLESLLKSFGLEPESLNEAYAVVISELEQTNNVTGIGLSFGAGLVNVAFVYKGMLLFSFSIDKSGDFIDIEASKASGSSESIINHKKEKDLNLNKDEFSVSPEERAIIFTYRYVINNTLDEINRAFTNQNEVNVIEPIPIIVSGGTSLPEGFNELFKSELENKKLPFEITEIIQAQNKLNSVAKGCLLWSQR